MDRSSDEFLGDRRRALEESFFAQRNQELLDQFKRAVDAESERAALAAASGINDQAVLDHLMAYGITAQTLAALSLVPLVRVAWADGRLDEAERKAALKAAAEAGVAENSPGHGLFDSWLAEPPSPELVSAWQSYVAALATALPSEARHAIAQDIVGRARLVAEAAGGFLGLGRKVSPQEQAVLDETQRAFA